MNAKKTILLIADIKNWSFDIIAKYVQSLLQSKYDCHIIYSNDYKTYTQFLEELNKYNSAKLIHFLYRGYLTELLYAAADSNNKLLWELFLNNAVTTGIPDHLFIDNQNQILRNLPCFQFIDNYYTTSKKLYDIYQNITNYPKPWKIIYDNVLIEDTNHDIIRVDANRYLSKLAYAQGFTGDTEPRSAMYIHVHEDSSSGSTHKLPAEVEFQKISNEKLTITWIGNSAWGSYHDSYHDYKGLNTIIIPALNQLDNDEIQIKRHIIDKKDHIRSRQEIAQILQETDILLIASLQEGTPLTLIEAMAFGCVVVTTDVGIAKEVLPDIQRQFIVNRSAREFIDSIKRLNSDRELLASIKQQNILAYQKIFANKDKMQNLWHSFIEDSIKTANTKQRLAVKKQILQDISLVNNNASLADKILKKIFLIPFTKTIAKFLLKYSWIKLIIKKAISLLYYYSSDNDYNNVKNHIMKYQRYTTNNDGIYALYSNVFPGVAHSTQTLFDKTIPLPIGGISLYGIYITYDLSTRVINKIAKLIITSGIKNLIISGGVDDHLRLVKRLHKIKGNNDLNVYFLWHGSPAQWVTTAHYRVFNKWLNLYNQHKIKAIITLKKGLEQFLIANGVQSYLLQNFIPLSVSPVRKTTNPRTTSKFRIGVWSAYNIWIKNLYPQFCAISMFKNQVACYTNFNFKSNKDLTWIMKNVQLKIFHEQLPLEELMQLMSNTDLTLYITNSECSPMIVLESLSLGVPCLVGPTADIYHDEFLRDMLTVNRVDCPVTIFKTIEKVQQNIDIIRSKLPDFIKKYNDNALILKNSLLKSIKNNHDY